MAQRERRRFEMQRLHGMGEGIYREVMQPTPSIPVRVYAPVGEHRDLLAYLVRRLLENGANSSFVHQLSDACRRRRGAARVAAAPADAPGIALPVALFASDGRRARQLARRRPRRAWPSARRCEQALAAGARRARRRDVQPREVAAAMARLQHGFERLDRRRRWPSAPALLRRAADALEARLPEFCALLVKEAHKTLGDCVAEVREAVDFCRYYADQAERACAPQALPGPTGESNELRLHGRGVFVCISPWNFPLAIFAGQVVAALVAGNTVAAKPAEQTPAVAQRFVALLHEAGVPPTRCALLHGPGETVGAALVADPRTAGVCFTGSHRGGAAHQPRAGRERRPDRAADRRDRRHQRDGGRQHRPARAGGRRGRAERLPLAPASAARRCACCACTRASPTA